MTTAKIDFESLRLDKGSHGSPAKGLCVMEAAAYFAGREHTDRPPCVSEVIGTFLRSWNDSLPDDPRQRLKPFVLKVIGTATTADDEERRAWMATDWLVRTFAPAWLDLVGLKNHAEKLRALPELTTSELAAEAQATINVARSAAAGDAARAATWDAARAATWAAAGDAARAATWDAARAATWAAARAATWAAARAATWDAARAAAWDAARAATWAATWDAARAAAGDAAWDALVAAAGDAAWDAARAATGDALVPTVLTLQESAFALLDRMIAVGKTKDAVGT